MAESISILLTAVRTLVGVAFLAAVIVAATHWAVRGGKIAPFGGWASFVRKLSDPALRPIERRVTRMGGNPQDAPLWLVGGVTVGGLLLLAGLDWLVGFIVSLYWSVSAGPRAILPFFTSLLFNVLMLALLVRVIGSWFGASPYGRVMRIAHGLTDWLVDPIRRILPPFGMIDFSPLVAWLVLSFTRMLVFRAFF